MIRKMFLAALVAALTGTAYSQDVQPKFDITPGFTISPNKADVKVKGRCGKCGDECKCPTGVCESGVCISDAVSSDPLSFACQIHVDMGGGQTAHGSGTTVHSEKGKTLILTNAHVVPKNFSQQPITVTSSGKTYKARYLDGSEVIQNGNTVDVRGPDLCLLEVDVQLGHVSFADAPPAVNDTVSLWGYGGMQPTAKQKTGRVLNNELAVPTLNHTAPTVNGDSGAGIFNKDGQLVGVHWGGTGGVRAYGVELTTVQTFLVKAHRGWFPRLTNRIEAKREAKAVAGALSAAANSAAYEAGREAAGRSAGPGDVTYYDPKTRTFWTIKAPQTVSGVKVGPTSTPLPPQPVGPWFNIQPASGCAGGNCPAPQPTRRR